MMLVPVIEVPVAEVPVVTMVLAVAGMTTEERFVPYCLAQVLQPFQLLVLRLLRYPVPLHLTQEEFAGRVWNPAGSPAPNVE